MPNETILQQIRTPLATALSSVAGNVYSFVPETVIPPAVVVGVDRDPAAALPGLHVLPASMPDFAFLVADRVGLLDLIIDDGSHLYPDYVATADVLFDQLRPGGVYVIEDIQTQDSVDALRAAGWQIEDWRESTGRYDDVIAWRVRE